MIITVNQDLDYFLDHHGVKGQKWGVRRAKRINAIRSIKGKAPLKPSQMVGSKVTRGAAYVLSYMVGSAVGGAVGRGVGGGSMLASAIGSTGGSVVGVVATNKILKNVGHKRMSEVDD